MTNRPTDIRCPYCGTEFKHSGKIEVQQCPKCHAQLIASIPEINKGEQK